MLSAAPSLRYAGAMDWTLASLFHCRPRSETLALTGGRPLRLTRARGRQVACEGGCVWITAPGEPGDIFLHSGQRWTIPVDGLVLVEAEGSAVVRLDC